MSDGRAPQIRKTRAEIRKAAATRQVAAEVFRLGIIRAGIVQLFKTRSNVRQVGAPRERHRRYVGHPSDFLLVNADTHADSLLSYLLDAQQRLIGRTGRGRALGDLAWSALEAERCGW